MAFQFIIFDISQQTAFITLNRPEVLNSLNREMALELIEALAQVDQRSEVRSVLLTGSGRGFCAGQDLAEFKPREGVNSYDLGSVIAERYNPIIRAIRHIEKPFVCAVNGIAAGAGSSIALACDLVLAAKSASFIQSFCKVGLIPDSGGTFFLPRLVGFGRANALMLLGEKVGAEEALSLGLIYKMTEDAALVEQARALAYFLAKQPTKGLGLIKRAVNASMMNGLDQQLEIERQLQLEAGNSEDYREGLVAFFEKRSPQFHGR